MTSDLPLLARSLLEAAQKATKGDWWIIDPDSTEALSGTHAVGLGDRRAVVFENAEENVEQDENDAAYIALCSPEAIARFAEGYLALTDEMLKGCHCSYREAYLETMKRLADSAEHLERAEQDAARLQDILEDIAADEKAYYTCEHSERARAALAKSGIHSAMPAAPLAIEEGDRGSVLSKQQRGPDA